MHIVTLRETRKTAKENDCLVGRRICFFSLRKTKQKLNKQKQMNFCLSGKIGANKKQHLQESSEPAFLQRCVIFNHCTMNIERFINTSAFTNCVIIRLIILILSQCGEKKLTSVKSTFCLLGDILHLGMRT